MIKFHCSKCGAKVSAPKEYVGRRAKCPSCDSQNIIPGEDEPMKYDIEEVKPNYNQIFCQHCGKEIMREAVICPKCGCPNELNKREAQKEDRVSSTTVFWVYMLALLFPLGGFIGGIWLMCKGEPAHGIACILVSIFIGIPLVLGVITRTLIIRAKGEEWFKTKYVPVVGKISIIALLMTLVVLFSLNGNVMISNFNLLLLVSVPLLLGFILVVGYNLLITRFTKLAYREGVITVIIGSSSHFEIAIATAIAIYGVGSVAALGTTMGLFWEIPIMVGLVYLAKYLRKKNWWKGTPI